MRHKKKKGEVINEYLGGEVSIMELGRKHGISRSTVHRWVKDARMVADGGQGKTRSQVMGEMPSEIKELKKRLYEAELKSELLETMIKIAEEDLGISIRKKSGAK